jgi:hypothetical protein
VDSRVGEGVFVLGIEMVRVLSGVALVITGSSLVRSGRKKIELAARAITKIERPCHFVNLIFTPLS